MKIHILRSFILTILVAVPVGACGPTDAEIATMTAAAWTLTPTVTLTPSPTATATLTPTSTLTETPTFTPTFTNTPLPPTATATIGRLPTIPVDQRSKFYYMGRTVLIDIAYLDETCSRASIRVDPVLLYKEALDLDQHQPAGTNCLVVMVSVPTGKYEGLDAMMVVIKLSHSTVIDQNGVVTERFQYEYKLYMDSNMIGARLLFCVPVEAISFTLVLPDGKKIPLKLAE